MPTAPETQNTEYSCADWGGTYDSKIRPQMENALEALDSLIIANNFDTSRQYLYGESMGGEGVYRLLSDFPERFAGAITVGGYTLTKSAKKMAKTPLWIVVGASDEINSVDSNKAMYDSIVNAGGTSVRYTAYPNLSHVGGIEKARTDSELTKWLLAQNCTTSVFKRIKMQNDALNQSSFLKFSHGNIHISSQLPQGSVVKLFDLSGQVLFKTITRNASITFPVQSVNRAVLWNISNNNFSISGKVPVCTK